MIALGASLPAAASQVGPDGLQSPPNDWAPLKVAVHGGSRWGFVVVANSPLGRSWSPPCSPSLGAVSEGVQE